MEPSGPVKACNGIALLLSGTECSLGGSSPFRLGKPEGNRSLGIPRHV
jgi:hypothetical protein